MNRFWQLITGPFTNKVLESTDIIVEENAPQYTAYCIKCKSVQLMLETERFTTLNNKPAIRGKCGACGTPVVRMGNM